MDRRQRTFERLYNDHAGPLLGFLVYRTGDRQLAEDLLADTFERVLTAKRGFDAKRGSEKTWLYTIALNCLRDHVRRSGVEAKAYEKVATYAGHHAPPPDEGVAERELVHRAVQRLPEDEREAIALRYGADLSLDEIAKVTGEKQTTVNGRVYRGLRRLRDDMD